jgi:hypothetical protein
MSPRVQYHDLKTFSINLQTIFYGRKIIKIKIIRGNTIGLSIERWKALMINRSISKGFSNRKSRNP